MASVASEPITAKVEEMPPWTASPGRSPSVIEPPPMVAGLPLYRITIDQYQRMGDHGIIDEKSKVVLINGLLVAKMGKNPPHDNCCDSLTQILVRAVPDGWFVSSQNSLLLPTISSLPEPDFKIVRGRIKDFSRRYVGAGDISIVIEISDSSVRADQTIMKTIYATSSIPEYWIVNLVARRIEVYTDPTGPDSSPDYRRRQDYHPGRSVPLRIDGRDVVQLAVDDILPDASDN